MFFGGFPNPSGRADIKKFTSVSTSTVDAGSLWHKPSGATMVYIYCVGGGGGGGGGFTGAAASARGGGGGGACSTTTVFMAPAWTVPECLTVRVGAGGQGVTTGTAGAGLPSYVGLGNPALALSNVLISSGLAAGAGGGGSGTAAAVGAGGVAQILPVLTSMPRGSMGYMTRIAGANGAAGGAVAGAIGGPVALPTGGQRIMPGAGGAGTTSADFAGGIITAVANGVISEGRPQGAAAGSNNGSGGLFLPQYMFTYGGLGGSSSNAGIGGAGGNGLNGCGGGGGGGGTTGGRGGDGGNGLVIIIAW